MHWQKNFIQRSQWTFWFWFLIISTLLLYRPRKNISLWWLFLPQFLSFVCIFYYCSFTPEIFSFSTNPVFALLTGWNVKNRYSHIHHSLLYSSMAIYISTYFTVIILPFKYLSIVLLLAVTKNVHLYRLSITRSTRPIDAKLWMKFTSLKCLILKHLFTFKHLHIKEPKYFRYFWNVSYMKILNNPINP